MELEGYIKIKMLSNSPMTILHSDDKKITMLDCTNNIVQTIKDSIPEDKEGTIIFTKPEEHIKAIDNIKDKYNITVTNEDIIYNTIYMTFINYEGRYPNDFIQTLSSVIYNNHGELVEGSLTINNLREDNKIIIKDNIVRLPHKEIMKVTDNVIDYDNVCFYAGTEDCFYAQDIVKDYLTNELHLQDNQIKQIMLFLDNDVLYDIVYKNFTQFENYIRKELDK